MSNKKLEELRALFKKEKENKTGNGTRGRGDMYPFWEMQVDEKAVVRILPDKNEDNPFMFFIEKKDHTLTINGKKEKVPCLQMYDEKCPICDLSRDFYKTEGKGSVNGKYYYRNKTSILRVLVIDDPLPADTETNEKSTGKVLNTQFSYQLMEKIKAEIGGDDLDTMPWDLTEGYNFNIVKNQNGDYATYTLGSGFARRPSAISEELRESIELVDLETLLPRNPGYEFVKNKLDSHLNGGDEGDSDDDDGDDDDGDAVPTPTKTEKPAKAEKPAKVEKPAPADDSDDDGDEDILAQILKNRAKK